MFLAWRLSEGRLRSAAPGSRSRDRCVRQRALGGLVAEGAVRKLFGKIPVNSNSLIGLIEGFKNTGRGEFGKVHMGTFGVEFLEAFECREGLEIFAPVPVDLSEAIEGLRRAGPLGEAS